MSRRAGTKRGRSEIDNFGQKELDQAARPLPPKRIKDGTYDHERFC